MPLLRLTPLALAVAVVAATAQDKKDEKKEAARQQQAVAAANLKKADIAKAAVVETDNFLIASELPAEKAKALGAVLEKVVPVARKVLQYEEKEEAWKGKLAVYYLPDGADFKNFIRAIVMKQPEGVHFDLRADAPFVVDPVEVRAKATEADQFAASAATVAGAYLKARAGTAGVPEWFVNGFGRVTAARAEGTNGKRYQAYKTAARAAVLGPKGGTPPAVADLWAETKPANAALLADSLAEYIAYGPGSANLLKFVYGFRPDEGGNVPGPNQAFEAAGWKDLAMLEAAWRKWVQTGK